MAVRCGYCECTHDNADQVRACYSRSSEADMRLLRRRLTKPTLHPLNEAAFARYTANAKRRQEDEPRDDERNLAGVRRARAALRQPAG